MSIPDPIFQLGKIPSLPHCIIQSRQWDGRDWKYFLYNSYNSYASGWGTEDFIIEQISKEKKDAS